GDARHSNLFGNDSSTVGHRVANYFPVKQHFFHVRPAHDVVDNHVRTTATLPVHHDPDMSDPASQVARHDVSWREILRSGRDGKHGSVPGEKDHQIRDAAVIYVWIWMTVPLLWIHAK